MRLILMIAVLLGATLAHAQKPAYQIFNAKGKRVTYAKMLKAASLGEVVLFGEQHNNAIAHWLEYELTVDLHDLRPLVLGAEMWEADNQDELNAYLAGTIDFVALDTQARLWPNYRTDYAPLVEFAKANNLRFVATNIPRRFASLVYKEGGFAALDGLSAEEKAWVAPLPIVFDPELPTYQNILTMMGEHGSPDLVKAQAIKDATMAHFILENALPYHLVVHYNGAYHSDQYEGIGWYLKQARPELKLITISTVSQAGLRKLEAEHRRRADFIIVVDENMTTTY